MNYPEGADESLKRYIDEIAELISTNTVSQERTQAIYEWVLCCVNANLLNTSPDSMSIPCGELSNAVFFPKMKGGSAYFDYLNSLFVNRTPTMCLWDGSTVRLSLSALNKEIRHDKVYASCQLLNIGEVRNKINAVINSKTASFAQRIFSTKQQLLTQIADMMIHNMDYEKRIVYRFDKYGISGKYCFLFGDGKFASIGMQPLSEVGMLEGFCRAVQMMPQVNHPIVISGKKYELKMMYPAYDGCGLLDAISLGWEETGTAAPLQSW